jgi:outer membrane lipoprotein-sorting protein
MAVLLFAGQAFAADIKFDFKKTTVDSGGTDIIGGFIFIRDPGPDTGRSLYFHVTYPVDQIMTFSKKETYVYYPSEKKCIIIVNRDEVSNFNFIGQISEKMDFSAMGYRSSGKKKMDGVTSEVWVPQSVNNALFKSITCASDGKGRLTGYEIRKKDGSLMLKASYGNYTKIEGKDIPLDIASYSSVGKSGYEERFQLMDPDTKPQLPDIIKDFKLPAGTSTERIEMK